MRIVIRSKKWKRPVSISLDDKYAEFLEKQPNRSEFIRKLLDKAMEEQKVKKELEVEKLDLERHPLTEDEVNLAAKLYVDFWFEQNHCWSDKKLLTDRHFTPDDLYNWQTAFEEAERSDLWQRFKEAVEKISEEDFLRPLKKAAEVLWQEQWRERYEKVIVADLTLEQACRVIDERAERNPFGVVKSITIKEVARMLHLNYQQVYKIAPLLEEEFGSFIKYRTKQD